MQMQQLQKLPQSRCLQSLWQELRVADVSKASSLRESLFSLHGKLAEEQKVRRGLLEPQSSSKLLGVLR